MCRSFSLKKHEVFHIIPYLCWLLAGKPTEIRIFNITESGSYDQYIAFFGVQTYLKPANFGMTPMCTSSLKRFAASPGSFARTETHWQVHWM
jgi:hypothetical protein